MPDNFWNISAGSILMAMVPQVFLPQFFQNLCAYAVKGVNDLYTHTVRVSSLQSTEATETPLLCSEQGEVRHSPLFGDDDTEAPLKDSV